MNYMGGATGRTGIRLGTADPATLTGLPSCCRDLLIGAAFATLALGLGLARVLSMSVVAEPAHAGVRLRGRTNDVGG